MNGLNNVAQKKGIWGEKIKAARVAAGLSQKALADMLHVSDRTISGYERGGSIPEEMLRKLMEALPGLAGEGEEMQKLSDVLPETVEAKEEVKEVEEEKKGPAWHDVSVTPRPGRYLAKVSGTIDGESYYHDIFLAEFTGSSWELLDYDDKVIIHEWCCIPGEDGGVDMGRLLSIKAFVREVGANAEAHGFRKVNKSPAELIALIHSEVSEILEELRAGHGLAETYYRADGKPEGVASELADVFIRCCDMADRYGIDYEGAILEKYEYSKTRPYLHGKEF